MTNQIEQQIESIRQEIGCDSIHLKQRFMKVQIIAQKKIVGQDYTWSDLVDDLSKDRAWIVAAASKAFERARANA